MQLLSPPQRQHWLSTDINLIIITDTIKKDQTRVITWSLEKHQPHRSNKLKEEHLTSWEKNYKLNFTTVMMNKNINRPNRNTASLKKSKMKLNHKKWPNIKSKSKNTNRNQSKWENQLKHQKPPIWSLRQLFTKIKKHKEWQTIKFMEELVLQLMTKLNLDLAHRLKNQNQLRRKYNKLNKNQVNQSFKWPNSQNQFKMHKKMLFKKP